LSSSPPLIAQTVWPENHIGYVVVFWPGCHYSNCRASSTFSSKPPTMVTRETHRSCH
jgi:hypothetical protein